MEQTPVSADDTNTGSQFSAEPQRPLSAMYANIVLLHWLAAPGLYLVLAPADPTRRDSRTRYIGPVSSAAAAELLKTSALALGIADRAFRHH